MLKINELIEKNSLSEGQYDFMAYLMSKKDLSDKDVIAIATSLFSDGFTTVSKS